VAVALFLTTPWVADCFLQASTPSGRGHTRRLVWEGIVRLCERGATVLNLGGGARPGDDLEAFKRRFGGHSVRGVSLKQVYDRRRFEEVSWRHGVPATIEGYFPAYWLEVNRPT
jgi:hypothetical protein